MGCQRASSVFRPQKPQAKEFVILCHLAPNEHVCVLRLEPGPALVLHGDFGRSDIASGQAEHFAPAQHLKIAAPDGLRELRLQALQNVERLHAIGIAVEIGDEDGEFSGALRRWRPGLSMCSGKRASHGACGECTCHNFDAAWPALLAAEKKHGDARDEVPCNRPNFHDAPPVA